MKLDDLNLKEYAIIEQVAAGRLGRVFLARQVNLGRYVLIRLMRTDAEEASHRFRNELEALSMLRHPNNAQVVDAGEATIDGIRGPYVVFQHVPGEPLDAVLERVDIMETATIIRLGRQLLGALSEAHRLGLLHRQLTPRAIWVSQHDAMPDHASVMDYGLEQVLQPSRWLQGALDVQSSLGDYIAPEVLNGQPATERSDIYSVGAVLHRCAVGQPFSGAGDTNLDLRTPEADQLGGVRMELLEVIVRALEYDPWARYSSTAAFLEALEPVFEQVHQVASVPPSLSTFALRPVGRVRAATKKRSPTLTDYPSVWVLGDDPALDSETLERLRRLAAHYRVIQLSREESDAYADALLKGDVKQPWLLIFGDLHVILQIRLLRVVRELSGTQKLLVSAKLNAQMLEATVNFCGVDQHFVLPVDDVTLSEIIESRIAVCRSLASRKRAMAGVRRESSRPVSRQSITGKFGAESQ